MYAANFVFDYDGIVVRPVYEQHHSIDAPMVLHRRVFDLFVRGLLGAVILLIVGIGSVVYAQHALRRAQTIAARIRRVSGIAFAISGTPHYCYSTSHRHTAVGP